MEHTITAQVVILPTNSYSPLIIHSDNNGLVWLGGKLGIRIMSPQHLYFISDEEIKTGDWCMRVVDNVTSRLRKCYSIQENRIYTVPEVGWGHFLREELQKIVASTDTLLGLPRIPEEWIRDKYVPANGKIDKVKLKLCCLYGDNCPSMGAFDKQYLCKEGLELKDNEVVIVDEPKVVKLEGGKPKSNHDGTFSITPLVAVYSDGTKSNDKQMQDEKELEKDAIKQPQFSITTEDGIVITNPEERVWEINIIGFHIIGDTRAGSNLGSNSVKVLSTREAAVEYIIQNKPVFSLKEVSEIITKENFWYITFVNLAKQRAKV